jgi:hypothetical protein
MAKAIEVILDPWISPRFALLILFFGLFISLPLLFAFNDTVAIPHRGNYDEICTHGHEVMGTIESVREGSDMDDDHWRVINFSYSHGGRGYGGTATSNNWIWKVGDQVTVRYLGNQAVLPEIQPVDVDPTNDFWLVLLFSLFLLVVFGFGVGAITGLCFAVKSVMAHRDGGSSMCRD